MVKCPICEYDTGQVGETLALQMLTMHDRNDHAPPPAAPTTPTTPVHARTVAGERVRRPTVSAAGTLEDWNYFEARWEEYVAATGITGQTRVLHLLECCDEELRKDVTRYAGKSLANTPEIDVMAAIKQLAVRLENVLLARFKLYDMRQDHDEPVRKYGARLRGQGNMCQYVEKCLGENCGRDVYFGDQILRDQLIRGVSDADIRLNIFQEKKQTLSLEEAFQIIEAKEGGKRSAAELLDMHEVAATKDSSYRRSQKQQNREKNNTKTSGKPVDINAECTFCGKKGHGNKMPPEYRQKHCPAYGSNCTFCSIPHHVEPCCRKKVAAASAAGLEERLNHNIGDDSFINHINNNSPFNQLCSLTNESPSLPTEEPTNESPTNLTNESPPLPTEEPSNAGECMNIVHHTTITSWVKKDVASTVTTPDMDNHNSSSQPNQTDTNTICTTKNTPLIETASINESPLEHHVYNQDKDAWVKKPAKPQPFLKLNISINPEDYIMLGIPSVAPKRSGSLHVMADTGCQSCLISYKLLRKLGIYKHHLVPVAMRMQTANNGCVDIIGAVVMRLYGSSVDGTRLETRQIVYVTETANKLFLNEAACMDLGLISRRFPKVGDAGSQSQVDTLASNETQETPCDCPRRSPPPRKPTKLPFPATKENRSRLHKWLLQYYGASAFNTCTHQPLNTMKTKPMRLMIDGNAKPRVHHKPHQVSLHHQDAVKKGLDEDVALGVLEKVPIGEPVTWLHQMVIGEKKNGKPRRTVDFQALNTHAIRETHHTQSPFHLARTIPHNTYKTVFDCWNSYHCLGLHPDDRHLTTFITPWGRYRYKVGPQGYAATGDGYTRRLDEIVLDIQRKVQCVDDACLWDSSIEEAFFHAIDWLDVCASNGITLNPEKFVFAGDTVEFAGFEVTHDSVRPCQKSLQAILDFPTPQNRTDMKAWQGLLQHMAYSFYVADRMQPFRHLLQNDAPFVWTAELNDVFEESKRAIVKEIEHGVRIFDKSKPTCIATDWSKTGIGFWLYQKHCDCKATAPHCCPTGWKVSMVGSRFTQQAESNYAPIEGEALAVAYALEKARFFVHGCDKLTLAVDHKPLLGTFSDRSLNIPNGRLRNLKEKTLPYRFTMHHIPGMKNRAADALSRNPSGETNPTRMELPDDICSLNQHKEPTTPDMVYFLSRISSVEAVDTLPMLQSEHGDTCFDVTTNTPDHAEVYGLTVSVDAMPSIQAVTWDMVREATNSDKDMQVLIEQIDNNFSDPLQSLSPAVRQFHRFQDDLFVVDGVALYRDRIVIPPSLRENIINILHSAHQGVTSMISRAESTVFWPGITTAIIERRNRCQECDQMAPSNPSAPPMPIEPPSYPFQKICADFFDKCGQHYLAIVDRYSNWPIVERACGGSKGLIDILKQTFMTFGIPDELSTDGGSEFTAPATKNFMKAWGIHHRQSAVAFPHSNCRAEIGVKTLKRMITSNISPKGSLNTDAFRVAMLQYRNTPDPETKVSPAMCLFGRPIKDFIPILPGRFEPHPTWQDTLQKREEALRNRHMKAQERWSEHTRKLPPLSVGDHVRVQNQVGHHPTKWDKTGTVVEVRKFDQYLVRMDGSGRATLRNRKFLRRFEPYQSQQQHPQHVPHKEPSPFADPFQGRISGKPHASPLPNRDDLEMLDRVPPVQPSVVGIPTAAIPPVVTPTTPVQPATVDTSLVPMDVTPTTIRAPSAPLTPPVDHLPVHRARHKVPLALRRLASHNKEGRVGIGEYAPTS